MHRSITAEHREADREEWWMPRAHALADFISDNLEKSDVVLLQEWWHSPKFSRLFDDALRNNFERVSERRPRRQDGMAVLVNKEGCLLLEHSKPILTGPQRIAQLVTCRERRSGRLVEIANTHLSFPSHEDAIVNDRRQAYEILCVARAMSHSSLQVIGGDFNSNIHGLAAAKLQSRGFVNCASASAEQVLAGTGGKVNLGVTHFTHRGEQVSVDHIYCKLGKTGSSGLMCTSMGYLQEGARITGCDKRDMEIRGRSLISDHMAVTATLEWPCSSSVVPIKQWDSNMVSLPLDPLEPPSYLGTQWNETVSAAFVR